MIQSRKIHAALGKFVFFWGFVQVALIGLAFFQVASSQLHAFGGLLLTVTALVMFITSISGKLGGRHIALSLLLLLILFPGQGFLIHAPVPAIARALHPVFGISVMFLGRYLGMQAAAAKK
jgi:hypothetical protein